MGDSWGSKLPKSEINKGISLILCQTQKGNDLLERANLHLETVNRENAIKHNGQLANHSLSHKNRDVFIEQLKEDKNFDKLVVRFLPKRVMLQRVKLLLIKLKILRGGYRIEVNRSKLH